jgi:hypothetical protein
MSNFPACKGEKIEYKIISTIVSTREVVGHSKHGFCVSTVKDTKGL